MPIEKEGQPDPRGGRGRTGWSAGGYFTLAPTVENVVFMAVPTAGDGADDDDRDERR